MILDTPCSRPTEADGPAKSLAGLRVLDFSRVFAGPLCTQNLADLGAEVLKVEHPRGGDDTRGWGPPFRGQESAYYLALNRGKRSLTLDLHDPGQLAQARALALQADVLVENFRAGWMAERALDYPSLSAVHPGLIYCSITAYGQDGPDRDLPGYDFLIQGRSGLMSITGDEEPMKVGVAVTDLITGLQATVGILAALNRRRQTGEGTYLDVSLLDCQVAGLVNVLSSYLVSGVPPRRYGNGHPTIVPYQAFRTADLPLLLAVGNDVQWKRFCRVVDRDRWVADPRFATNADRVVHRTDLIPLLEGLFLRRSRAEWIEALDAAEVPVGPIQDLGEVVTDPQVLAREMIVEVSDPVRGELRLAANPLLRGGTPRAYPPALGEGGAELAARWLAATDRVERRG